MTRPTPKPAPTCLHAAFCNTLYELVHGKR
ncbi:hypothetical protein SNARM312S_06971 [Streptomyces narbonensis]